MKFRIKTGVDFELKISKMGVSSKHMTLVILVVVMMIFKPDVDVETLFNLLGAILK